MSDKIKDGGPAFPHQFEDIARHPRWHQSLGMSLRDWFAGQALMSLPHLCAHDTLLNGVTFGQHVARNAYEIADAMIEARETPHD